MCTIHVYLNNSQFRFRVTFTEYTFSCTITFAYIIYIFVYDSTFCVQFTSHVHFTFSFAINIHFYNSTFCVRITFMCTIHLCLNKSHLLFRVTTAYKIYILVCNLPLLGHFTFSFVINLLVQFF